MYPLRVNTKMAEASSLLAIRAALAQICNDHSSSSSSSSSSASNVHQQS
jgi:hypothetical protein